MLNPKLIVTLSVALLCTQGSGFREIGRIKEGLSCKHVVYAQPHKAEPNAPRQTRARRISHIKSVSA
jgi:hypothetical protein